MTASISDVKDHHFDYVVVGGGAAGLTVAARLSEEADKTVCILEAGGDNLDDQMICGFPRISLGLGAGLNIPVVRPGGYGTHLGNKLYDWAHETV